MDLHAQRKKKGGGERENPPCHASTSQDFGGFLRSDKSHRRAARHWRQNSGASRAHAAQDHAREHPPVGAFSWAKKQSHKLKTHLNSIKCIDTNKNLLCLVPSLCVKNVGSFIIKCPFVGCIFSRKKKEEECSGGREEEGQPTCDLALLPQLMARVHTMFEKPN